MAYTSNKHINTIPKQNYESLHGLKIIFAAKCIGKDIAAIPIQMDHCLNPNFFQ